MRNQKTILTCVESVVVLCVYHMKRPKKITASSLEFRLLFVVTTKERDARVPLKTLESFFSCFSDVVLVLVSRPLLMTKENREK